MTDQALAQATYQYIKEFEGFIGQVHYDSKRIPTLGAGLALIYYDSDTNKYGYRGTVGNMTMVEFLTYITQDHNKAVYLDGRLRTEAESLDRGTGNVLSLSDYGISITEDYFINNIYGGYGNDTYVYCRGDGILTINDDGSRRDTDRILFGEGVGSKLHLYTIKGGNNEIYCEAA